MEYKILVGEPEEIHQLLLMRHLQILGYPTDLGSLEFSPDCGDFLEKVESGRYDILFVDSLLSGSGYRDGLAAACAVKDMGIGTPLVLTSSDESVEGYALNDAGATAFLRKPYKTEHLGALIRRLV